MRKVAIFAKLSFRYWTRHIKRIFTLAAVCMLGAAALCFSCLYIRSEKASALEQTLVKSGNYDAIFYGVEEADLSLISENKEVTSYGFYRELGYASANGSEKYKVASFPDESSAQIYHMTCIQGNYPNSEGEIAIDANVAKMFGIAPLAGQRITLALYDMEQQAFGEREYIVSGIFQATSENVSGGFYRYPQTGGMDGYGVPAIFVPDNEKNLFESSLITVFLQAERDVTQLAVEIKQSGFSKLQGFEIPLGRTIAYSDTLGVGVSFNNEYGEFTVSNLLCAIRDGNIWRDFYSSVLIPLLAGLVLVIVAVSVFSLIRSIIMGRSREIAILRSIGMTKQGIFLYLFAELMILTGIFLITGIIAGGMLHYLLIKVMNAYNHTDIPLGFHVNVYVASVTPQPCLYASAVIGISSVAAIFLPLLKMAQSTPIAVFKKSYWKKAEYFGRHFSDFSKCSWKTVISKHIRFHDRSVLIFISIIISAAFFGYNYFRAFTDMKNSEYRYELEESGLKGWDFIAEKSSLADPYEFLIENHHDYGIDETACRSFAEEDFVEDSFMRIVNKSTRLAYPKSSTPEAVEEQLTPLSMRSYEAYKTSADAFEHTEYEAEDAMLEQIGYHADENIYAFPTVGVLPEELAALSPYIIAGELNVEKIKSGKEVLIVLPAEMKDAAADMFCVGDTLPLGDIILSQEEETYAFSSASPFDYAEPVYLTYVKEPGGATVRYASFAFGARKNIETTVGAVAVLEEENLYEKYMLPVLKLPGIRSGSAAAYAPGILCLPDTFINWGLPDRLFTEAKFTIKEQKNLQTANSLFYRMIGGCSGLSFASSYEIRENMEDRTRNTMTIYYIMILTLIFLGMIAVGIKLYSRIKLRAKTIARLRAIGMSLPQIERLILRQNAVYPLIGGVLAMIPVSLCQLFFLFIRHQIHTGAWESITVNRIPWYMDVPFWYNLFAYRPILVLLLIVVVFEVLMFLAAVPQIQYMRKQMIADMIDTDSF